MGAPSIRCAVVTRPARHNKTLPRQSVPRQGKFNPTPRAEASESSNWDDTEPPNQLPDMFQGKRQQQQAGREGYLPLTRSITPPGTSRREAQNPPPLGRRASPDVIQRKHPGRTNTPYINQVGGLCECGVVCKVFVVCLRTRTHLIRAHHENAHIYIPT